MSFPSDHVPGKFETNGPLRGPALVGTIAGWITEPNGVEPAVIVDASKDAEVHLKWTLEGPLTPFVCGYWCVSIHLESIGDGPEFSLPPQPVQMPLHPCPGPNEYEACIKIPAGKIERSQCAYPYKLVGTVTYQTVKWAPGPMVGFVEFPVVTFYYSSGEGPGNGHHEYGHSHEYGHGHGHTHVVGSSV